jgi:hypothetical protein
MNLHICMSFCTYFRLFFVSSNFPCLSHALMIVTYEYILEVSSSSIAWDADYRDSFLIWFSWIIPYEYIHGFSKLAHDRYRPHTFKIIIHHHAAVRSCVACTVGKTSSTKPITINQKSSFQSHVGLLQLTSLYIIDIGLGVHKDIYHRTVKFKLRSDLQMLSDERNYSLVANNRSNKTRDILEN